MARVLFWSILIVGFWGQSYESFGSSQEEDKAYNQTLEKVENYLNTELKGLKADFIQNDSRGNQFSGVFYLSRPGKFRIDYYNHPDNLLIVSNGDSVLHYDRNLEAPTYIPLDATPAHFISRLPLRFQGDITVMRLFQLKDEFGITIVKTDDPGAGNLTLFFREKPRMLLTRWSVEDAQGGKTYVRLLNIISNPSLAPDLFKHNIKG